MIKQKAEQDRAATLRAGLIAATILNVNRRKGTPLVQPQDFLAENDEWLTPEQAAEFMDKWAASQGSGMIVTPTDAEVAKFTEVAP